MIIFRIFIIFCVLSSAAFISTDALAKKKGGGVIRLEETVIEGRVQKPNAFFINTREALVFEIMEIKESFLAEISKVLEKDPF